MKLVISEEDKEIIELLQNVIDDPDSTEQDKEQAQEYIDQIKQSYV